MITQEFLELVELLNDLERLYPLGTIRVPQGLTRLPSPEPEAPDGWHWLPPGAFPDAYSWLATLAALNIVRLTYTVTESLTIRIYVVPDDLSRLGHRLNKRGKHAFGKLLSLVDTSTPQWHNTTSPDHVKQDLLSSGTEVTLAQIYNDLDSPTGKLPDDTLTFHEKTCWKSIQSNNVPGLMSQLYPYQARSVQSMFLREIYPIQLLDPRSVRIIGATGLSLYIDLEEKRFNIHPTFYDTPAGGILGEEMGSGKTCESLALILVSLDQMPANPALAPGSDLRLPEQVSQSAGNPRSLRDIAAECCQIGNVPTRWQPLSQNCLDLLQRYRPSYIIPPPALRSRSRRSTMDDNGIEAVELDTRPGTQMWLSHGTLVVVPDTLLSQWRHEITKHVQPGVLKVLVIGPINRKLRDEIPPLSELLQYDIVLIPHSRFAREEEQIGQLTRCLCTYVGRTRVIVCTCPPPVKYVSPLTSVHWKRLIVDEGHSMSSQHTKAVRFAASLYVERKWIVSGTPSRGLVGAAASGQEGTPDERFDLDKLAITMIEFLGLQALDKFSWKRLITKPFLDRAPGAESVVRHLLNSMIVRNRQADIQKDVVLPPLRKRVIYLDATTETVRTQNIFNALIAINAVTSQRMDQDCKRQCSQLTSIDLVDFFHKSQAGPLQAVVRNMLVSTFHWTGTSIKDIEGALSVARQARLVHGATYSQADRDLLDISIRILDEAKNNDHWVQSSEKHEMSYYLDNRLPRESSQYYLLTTHDDHILGGTAVIEAQRAIREALRFVPNYEVTSDERLIHGLTSAGIKNRAREAKEVEAASKIHFRKPTKQELKSPISKPNPSPTGNATIKRSALSKSSTKLVAKRNKQVSEAVETLALAGEDLSPTKPKTVILGELNSSPKKSPVAVKEEVTLENQQKILSEAVSLAPIAISSTSASKLNYLITEVRQHSRDEKIIIFSDFVDHTYHLAEALDIIGVPYLLYTSSLKAVLKNRYILTFNTSETFRVMIMDLHLAAHGLNLSTASRVYFVQQCWSGAIESQAIKRAHRIGQTRPVTVEILVLRGSIEEAVQRRRLALSGRELGDTKNITDDSVLRNAIKNPTFLEPPRVRTLLTPPIPLFTLGEETSVGEVGLVPVEDSPTDKATATVSQERPSRSASGSPTIRSSKKRARFDVDGDEAQESDKDAPWLSVLSDKDEQQQHQQQQQLPLIKEEDGQANKKTRKTLRFVL